MWLPLLVMQLLGLNITLEQFVVGTILPIGGQVQKLTWFCWCSI
jgi:hypothetical protein